jgi:DeoR/GlpR family transcriptional regulator of sugar metabolism
MAAAKKSARNAPARDGGAMTGSGADDRKKARSARSYFDIQEEKRQEYKAAVADLIAGRYFHEGDSILLDAGTSLYPLANRIVSVSKDSPDSTHFTIMTHNYRAFEILVGAPKEANLNIVLAGGRYDQDLKALFGAQTSSNYETFFPRTVVIGISGLVADVGLFCHGNTEELQVKELIFKKACARRIIVADHTKLGQQDSFLFGKSVDLRAGTDECVVVTTMPSQSDNSAVRDRYHGEVEKLRKKYGITVEEVDFAKRSVPQ